MKARLVALVALGPAAITYGLSALHVAPPLDGWEHFVGLLAFSSALVGVPIAVILVGLHALKPTPRRAWLCEVGALMNLAAVSLFLLAAAIAATSIVDTTLVFVFFSLFPAAAAAALLARTGATSRAKGLDDGQA